MGRGVDGGQSPPSRSVGRSVVARLSGSLSGRGRMAAREERESEESCTDGYEGRSEVDASEVEDENVVLGRLGLPRNSSRVKAVTADEQRAKRPGSPRKSPPRGHVSQGERGGRVAAMPTFETTPSGKLRWHKSPREGMGNDRDPLREDEHGAQARCSGGGRSDNKTSARMVPGVRALGFAGASRAKR